MTAPREHFPVQPLGDWARDPDRACVQPGVNPAVFFPRTGGVGQAAAARSICRGCPVRVECGTDALNHPWVWGIWGGTSEGERRNMRRRGQVTVQ
jgi:WhiB family redox-sensing transcriptional regulator